MPISAAQVKTVAAVIIKNERHSPALREVFIIADCYQAPF